jgi:hypothetical protein
MRPEWANNGQVRILVQESTRGDDELNRRGIPLSIGLASNEEQRQML